MLRRSLTTGTAEAIVSRSSSAARSAPGPRSTPSGSSARHAQDDTPMRSRRNLPGLMALGHVGDGVGVRSVGVGSGTDTPLRREVGPRLGAIVAYSRAAGRPTTPVVLARAMESRVRSLALPVAVPHGVPIASADLRRRPRRARGGRTWKIRPRGPRATPLHPRLERRSTCTTRPTCRSGVARLTGRRSPQ
jgi:hypothetical protein